jgi:hypothetical protein
VNVHDMFRRVKVVPPPRGGKVRLASAAVGAR